MPDWYPDPFVVPADEYARLIDALAERDEARAEVERLRERAAAFYSTVESGRDLKWHDERDAAIDEALADFGDLAPAATGKEQPDG